jgi:two-component system, cell cycle response regulator DivK
MNTPPLVLIVDDVDDNRDLYEEYLLFRGFQVLTADNGADCLRIADARRPDIILLDLRMPGMSGLETLVCIRTRPELEGVPVVALTAHALDDERRRALASGFDAFIPKPCLPDDLVTAIDQILRGSPPVSSAT